MRWTTGMQGALGLLLAAGGVGCAEVAEYSWAGDDGMGAVRSAEWIRYTATDDYTFTGELTLNYFVLSNVPDLCGEYQTAVADSFDAHTDYLAARAPFQEADDMASAELCQLTKAYYETLGAATATIAKAGRAYVSTTFGFANVAAIEEEGQPQEGTFQMSQDALAEDGDFFRAHIRFFDDNPYTVLADSMDCASGDWLQASGRSAYTEYRGEPVITDGGEELGTLQSELLGDNLVHLAHSDVTAVTGDRTMAGRLDSNAEYLKCQLTTHGFFLRIFER